jgi:hypothetical protein
MAPMGRGALRIGGRTAAGDPGPDRRCELRAVSCERCKMLARGWVDGWVDGYKVDEGGIPALGLP